MPPRNRKRGQRRRKDGEGVARRGPATSAPEQPAQSAVQGPPAATRPAHRSRSEERNELIRAQLTPLAPGERPWPLKVAALLALVIAVADIVQVAVGAKVKFGSTHTSVGGVALFSLIMLVCAVGMWQLRYWAVLGFEALLAVVILAFCFVLISANDVVRAVIAVAVIAGCGYLFFKLVRVLSRLQMPAPPGRG